MLILFEELCEIGLGTKR